MPIVGPGGYTADMTPTTIKSIVDDATGPYKITMADGAEMTVYERDHLVVTSTHLMLGLDPDESGIPTRSRYLDARSVTQIEPLPATQDAA